MDKRNEILNAHKRRFATKAFDPTKKIADEDWATILEAGRLSPSSWVRALEVFVSGKSAGQRGFAGHRLGSTQ